MDGGMPCGNAAVWMADQRDGQAYGSEKIGWPGRSWSIEPARHVIPHWLRRIADATGRLRDAADVRFMQFMQFCSSRVEVKCRGRHINLGAFRHCQPLRRLSVIFLRLALSHTNLTARAAEAWRGFWGYDRLLLAWVEGAHLAMANVVWAREAKKSSGLRG